MPKKNPGYSIEEEARIAAEMAAYQQKAREAEIQAEIQNRILDEQRKKPGYKYY